MVILLSIFLLMFPAIQTEPAPELWRRYPVSASGLGEGGSFDADLTLEPAIPITLTFSADGDYLLAARAISAFLSERPEMTATIRLERTAPDTYTYQSGEAGESGTVVVHLHVEEGQLHGAERITYVMGEASQTFILAPVAAPDPRSAAGPRCEGGPRIRLSIGDVAVTGMASGEVPLYASLDSGSAISAIVNRVTVIAGPLCVDQIAWWQVRLLDDPDSVAWTPEMLVHGGYLLRPLQVDAHPTPPECPGAPDSRLSVGAFVQPAESEGAPTLHMTPDAASAVIARLPDEAFYRVLDGPVCAAGNWWWLIEHDGDNGWVAEGQGDNYALAPNRAVILSKRLQEMAASG